MLLRLLELHESGDKSYPLDEVVFCDTTMEFPEMYERFEAEGCPKKYGFNMDSKSLKTYGRENTKEKAGE